MPLICCARGPQWLLLAARAATSPGTAETRATLAGEQGGSTANRPHHGCICTQSAPVVLYMVTKTPNQLPVSLPKSEDYLVFKCPVSTEDLVLNGTSLNTGIPGHASLLPEHLNHASFFYYVQECVCCVHTQCGGRRGQSI